MKSFNYKKFGMAIRSHLKYGDVYDFVFVTNKK